ncbi:MAG: hypothetical protein JSS32_01265 [Verrucomicrobia bacterium]|nr:hypothetical protein [Verrucomicrobiota bacterium]
MLNVFSKTKPWMLASLLAATSVFGQTKSDNSDRCRPKACEPMPAMQLMPAYNAPARIDVRGSWDIYAGGSFTYWQARQENMELGASVVSSVAPAVPTAGSIVTGNVINHDFAYKPGFKVFAGINFDHDAWDAYAEYTWYYGTTTTSSNGPAQTTTQPYGYLTPLDEIGPLQPIAGSEFSTASQKWRLKMQFLDTAMARTYYVGTKLTFRSIFGARFAWFTQSKKQTFINSGNLLVTPTSGSGGTGTLFMHQSFSSWGAGLMAGLNTNWNFGEGFRMIGNGSFDLLYTRVQTTNTEGKFTNTAGTTQTRSALRQPRPDFLMPHMNIEMGFGWGSYFDCSNWHIDFAATYGFQVFWNANLFRQFHSTTMRYSSHMPNGNLYVHGLTATMRIDF